jgi:hypothetical protein
MKDMGPDMIAPAAKKLWGIEAKDVKPANALHLSHEGVWRDTWAAPGDTGPLVMGRRPPGSGYPGGGGDTGSILSPRGSDTGGGLGVKMVEYVLGTSPTNKDSLEPRMRSLHLDDKNDKDKPQSPKEDGTVVVNGQAVVVQNGQGCVGDEDKGFNRTPGSRQPSPAEEDLSKNGVGVTSSGALQLEPGVVILKAPQEQQLPPHLHQHLAPAHHLAPHLGVTLAESVNSQFEHFGEQPPPPYDQHQYAAPPPPQPHQVDSAVLQQQQHNFDVQVSVSSTNKF